MRPMLTNLYISRVLGHSGPTSSTNRIVAQEHVLFRKMKGRILLLSLAFNIILSLAIVFRLLHFRRRTYALRQESGVRCRYSVCEHRCHAHRIGYDVHRCLDVLFHTGIAGKSHPKRVCTSMYPCAGTYFVNLISPRP